MMHYRKSLLFDNAKPWRKRNNSTVFDVMMGSFDGAEVCELVGLNILDILTKQFNNRNIGLYRDDGLAAFRNMGAKAADKIRKQFSAAFNEVDLRITAQSNM